MLPLDTNVKVRKLTQKSPFKLDLKGLFNFFEACFSEAILILDYLIIRFFTTNQRKKGLRFN
jgi:hypothetical protein